VRYTAYTVRLIGPSPVGSDASTISLRRQKIMDRRYKRTLLCV